MKNTETDILKNFARTKQLSLKPLMKRSQVSPDFAVPPPGSPTGEGGTSLMDVLIGRCMHAKNTNNVNALRHTLNNFLSELTSSGKHKENMKSRLRSDETAVQAITALLGEGVKLFAVFRFSPF